MSVGSVGCLTGGTVPTKVMTLRYQDVYNTELKKKQLPTNMDDCLGFVKTHSLVGGSSEQPADLLKEVFVFNEEGGYNNAAAFIVICYFAYETWEQCPEPRWTVPQEQCDKYPYGQIVGLRTYHFLTITDRSIFSALRNKGNEAEYQRFNKDNCLRLSQCVHVNSNSIFDRMQREYLQFEAPYLKYLVMEPCDTNFAGYLSAGMYGTARGTEGKMGFMKP